MNVHFLQQKRGVHRARRRQLQYKVILRNFNVIVS